MENVDISRLIMDYLYRRISDSDKQLLDKWVNESDENKERFKNLTDTKEIKERLTYWSEAGGNKEGNWEILLERRKTANQAPVKRLFTARRYLQVAAAILIIVVGASVYLKQFKPAGTNSKAIEDKTSIAGNDVQPGSEKAILKLSDGRSISVDSISRGVLAKQGELNIVKADGTISYQGPISNIQEVEYNTLVVPRGGQYRLLLKDGTKVWVNSASTIRYPTFFKPGMPRSVEVTGEVYFEVAKATSDGDPIPFIVGTPNDSKIEVLGTHFNVNAYDDEPFMATTLVEGKVKVTRSSEGKLTAVVLNPGEQAVIKSKESLHVSRSINLDQVTAWKDGKFYFANTEFAVAMRQISRWYDVVVVYEGKVPEFKINGEVSKSVTLANLLSMFASTDIKCKIEGNKLLIPVQ